MTAHKRRWFRFGLLAMLMVTLGCGLLQLCNEFVLDPVRPSFQLDVVLSQEELADHSVRDRALDLLERAADSEADGRRRLAIFTGLLGTVASLLGFLALSRDWQGFP
jgi:hypothetical protein